MATGLNDILLNEIVKNYLHLHKQNELDVSEFNLESIAKVLPDVDASDLGKILTRIEETESTGFNNGTFTNKQDAPLEMSLSNVNNYVQSMLLDENDDRPSKNKTSSSTKGSVKGMYASSTKKYGKSSPSQPQKGKNNEYGANMVIHVCDEAKNLKQDFVCPRDLLIHEMKYFAEYLSIESQRLEEVDISVHCDIHIFHWLMCYVKRNTDLIDESDVPRLESTNVISILISSDFLQMDSLVAECISYCHENLSVILATPCNMNCINDKLTSKIAAKFDHNELEDVKDRKDKFKSKLFCKKIENLFNEKERNSDTLAKANTLFKCVICERIMTKEQSSHLECANHKLTVNRLGGLSYKHAPDNSWDVATYITSLHEELKKWNLVYWRLWGTINHLKCSRCQQSFQLVDFGCCQYHPERPQYSTLESLGKDKPVGLYPCCNQHLLRFDPTGFNKGCKMRDHVVTTSKLSERNILDDLLAHKSLIKVSSTFPENSGSLNIFAAEENKCLIKETTTTPVDISHSSFSLSTKKPLSANADGNNQARGFQRLQDVGYDEDDLGEEEVSHRVQIKSKPQHSIYATKSLSSITNDSASKQKKPKILIPKDITVYKKFPSKQRWEVGRSVRWNQDVQREEDRRRLNAIAYQLTKRRMADKTDSKNRARDLRELPGGLFCKLELSFFNSLKSHGSSHTLGFNRPGQNANVKDLKVKRGR